MNKPVIAFNSFNGCSRNVSVNNQDGVSFQWSNGQSGTSISYEVRLSYAYVSASACGQTVYSDNFSLPSPPDTLSVSGSTSLCKSSGVQNFSASTCVSVNSNGWNWSISGLNNISSLSSSNQTSTSCDNLFQFTSSSTPGYYTIYCSNGSLSGQLQI